MSMKAPVNPAKWTRCLLVVAAGVILSALIQLPAQAQAPVRTCESLAGVTLPNNTTITYGADAAGWVAESHLPWQDI